MNPKPILYQEQFPERARTHCSVAEAFRTAEYACAVELFKAPGPLARLCWLFCGRRGI